MWGVGGGGGGGGGGAGYPIVQNVNLFEESKEIQLYRCNFDNDNLITEKKSQPKQRNNLESNYILLLLYMYILFVSLEN